MCPAKKECPCLDLPPRTTAEANARALRREWRRIGVLPPLDERIPAFALRGVVASLLDEREDPCLAAWEASLPKGWTPVSVMDDIESAVEGRAPGPCGRQWEGDYLAAHDLLGNLIRCGRAW